MLFDLHRVKWPLMGGVTLPRNNYCATILQLCVSFNIMNKNTSEICFAKLFFTSLQSKRKDSIPDVMKYFQMIKTHQRKCLQAIIPIPTVYKRDYNHDTVLIFSEDCLLLILRNTIRHTI